MRGEGARRAITVMTYNVGNGLATPERLTTFLNASGADVIGLQEVNEAQALAILRDASLAYPHQAVRGTGFTGRALLSRQPLLEVAWLDLSPARPDLMATIAIDGLTVTVVVAHPPPQRLHRQGLLFEPETLRQLDQLAHLVPESSPAVLLGDFNMTARNPGYAGLVAAGLIDAFRAAGAGRGSTFPLRPGRTRRVKHPVSWMPLPPLTRIDYIWHTPDLRTVSSWVAPGAGSDHRPVFARLAAVVPDNGATS